MFARRYRDTRYLTSTKPSGLSQPTRFDLFLEHLAKQSLGFKARQFGEDARFGSRGEVDGSGDQVAIDQRVEVKCLLVWFSRHGGRAYELMHRQRSRFF